MRFIRSARHSFTDTPRKRAALHRKQKAERAALPLFAAEIAASHKSPDDVMQARAAAWASSEARSRQRRADQWRRARCLIDAMPPRQRRRVRAAWDGAPYPADPVYLLDFLHSLEAGRFALDALPFTPRSVTPRGHAIA
tara:strand:+ start:52 stop:468 length:417 start_codon:yes stop_codon:yes gene_type:complete